MILSGLRFFGHHGVSEEERSQGGEITVDLEVEADLGPAGASDSLADTVNYVELHRVVREIVERRRFHLLEALASELARALLELPGVLRVHLTVAKEPRLPGQSTGFAVRITRPL